jgi:tRNA threonylcarbamoyladenosine biosynthesis protein TsaE
MYIESKDNMETYVSNSLAETENFAREIAERVKESKFLALYGGMGAGKTSFVRGLVRALCPECLDLVHSPTFAIVNEYRGNGTRIFHFDLYRIDGADDLESIGFDDYLRAEGYCIAEWSSRVPDEIPEDAIKVVISRDTENEMGRIIEITGLPV